MATRYAAPCTFRPAIRSAMLAALLIACTAVRAQVLFVNDNNNITYNTDTVLNDLTAAIGAYDVYDIEASGGVPPSFSTLDAHDLVIWYCSNDGTELGFWDATAQDDILQYVFTGKKLWIIGLDLFYAFYPPPPHAFAAGDLAFDVMGIGSYDAQSFGDDGGLGVSEMFVDPSVAAHFQADLHWSVGTLWWADACTPLPGTQVIYRMGPAGYALADAPSMVHFHGLGTNVMSTLFEPALIDTYEARVDFLQESIAYLEVVTGIDVQGTSAPLHIAPGPAGDVLVRMDERMTGITVHTAHGALVYTATGTLGQVHTIPAQGRVPGLYLVRATTANGRMATGRYVRP